MWLDRGRRSPGPKKSTLFSKHRKEHGEFLMLFGNDGWSCQSVNTLVHVCSHHKWVFCSLLCAIRESSQKILMRAVTLEKMDPLLQLFFTSKGNNLNKSQSLFLLLQYIITWRLWKNDKYEKEIPLSNSMKLKNNLITFIDINFYIKFATKNVVFFASGWRNLHFVKGGKWSDTRNLLSHDVFVLKLPSSAEDSSFKLDLILGGCQGWIYVFNNLSDHRRDNQWRKRNCFTFSQFLKIVYFVFFSNKCN